MRKIFCAALLAVLCLASASEAGLLRKILGRGKAAAGKVCRGLGGCR